MTIIDTDSHAVEPPDLWTTRMASKWGDAIPHVRFVPERNSDVWFVGDEPVMHAGMSVIAPGPDGGIRRKEDFPAFITKFGDMHPSAWDPNERAKVMDGFGIATAALYPNLGFVGPDIYRVLPNTSLEYQVEVARCYNDWVLEWAQQQPGRFIPLACIPYFDVPSAVQEIERCAELGHHGFVTTGAPDLHGEPFMADRHWDPMWAAAEATGLPISFHSGSGNKPWTADRMRRLEVEGPNYFMVRGVGQEFLRNGIIACDLIMSGVLARFPELKFILVESGVGWVPFALETLDWHFLRYRDDVNRPEFAELPSHYFKRQVYVNSWFERLTQWHVDNIGAGNLLFETDYPHPTCLLDGEIDEAITTGLGSISAEDRERILWKNAVDLFQLDGEEFQAARAATQVGAAT